MTKLSIKTPKLSVLAVAAVFVASVFAAFAPVHTTSASSGAYVRITNNCGETSRYGVRYASSKPGTGSFYKVASGKTATYNFSKKGTMYVISLPRGSVNISAGFVNYTLKMC